MKAGFLIARMSTIDVSDAYLESLVGGSETATALLNICRHFCEIFRERDRLGARGWFPAKGDDFTPPAYGQYSSATTASVRPALDAPPS